MSPRPGHATAHDVLWELGAAIVDASLEDADVVVGRVLADFAARTGAASCSVWSFDRETLTGTSDYRWAIAGADRGDAPVTVPPSVRDAVDANDGLASFDLEQILGAEECEARGWHGVRAVVAVLDKTADATIALVVAGTADMWDDDAMALVRGVTVLLRQFHRRVRTERELRYRLRLEDLVASIGERLLTIGPDELDDTITSVIEDLRSLLELRSVVVIDVIGEDRVGIPYMAADDPLADEWREVPVPDISRVPGGEGISLAEFVARPHILDLADIVDALMGPDASEAFGLRAVPHSVALLPAAVDNGRSLIAVSRERGAEWQSHEIDAFTTIASLLAQVRGRVAAQRSSRTWLEVQRTLAATGRAFLETDAAGADDAIHEALRSAVELLGADLAVVSGVLPDGDTVTIHHSWSATPGLVVPVGAGLSRSVHPLIERLIAREPMLATLESTDDLAPPLRDSPDARWSTAVAPVRGFGHPAALALVWARADAGEPAVVRDFANALADIIGQLKIRVRAEAELLERLDRDAVLGAIADDFLGATLADVDDVLVDAFASLGDALDLWGINLRRIGGGLAVAEATWSADPGWGPAKGQAVPIDDVQEHVSFDGYQMRSPLDERLIPRRDAIWGPGTHTEMIPVYVGGRVRAVLVVATRRPLTESDQETLRAFAVMLGQLRARMAEESRGLRRLEAQRLLSACAGDLAEARIDDFGAVTTRVLERVGTFCELGGLANVRVDRVNRRHIPRSVWRTDEFAAADTGAIDFGTIPILDRAVSGERLVVAVEPEPTVARPTCLAIPRRGRDGVHHVLIAARLSSEPWADEDVELLGSLNHLLQEVEARIAAQRYSESAFASAPVGIVLRNQRLELITCNQAFVDFVGAGSVDELVGTLPDAVYDEAFEQVEWTDTGGELRTEAAFRGPGGSRVWGQLRVSPMEDEVGESFWLVHVEDVTERRRAEQLLRFQASHDELTGLANRRRLLQEIHRIAAGDGSVAVLLLDLDRFKIINDSLGHDRGDELLVVVADRLRLAVRPGDLVARLGGDEFAIVLPGPVSVADAEIVADRMMRLIGEPVTLGRHQVYPTASIGIAVADEHTAIDDLLRRADTAMYRAKAQGRAQSAAFDEALREAVTARMATESGLRAALRGHELVVHYQPEVSLHDGRMLGAEALVRWCHPERGLLAAAEFIEVAEETGLVVDIGEYVLATACREAARWPGGERAPIVRVNLAAAQLQREETVAQVRSALTDAGLDPSRLCLEITESAVMTDIRRSEEILARLKAIGVSLAIDDFGTGFSSLAYLKRFPVDVLKIDRAFVRDLGEDLEDEAFVRSIVSLAEALGLAVVAEGVETEAQAERLRALGCSRAQGHLFARPGPAGELDRLLSPLAR